MSSTNGTPRLDRDSIEQVSMSKLGAFWRAKTKHSVDDVLAEGFFDGVASHGLRIDDLLVVTTNAGQAKRQHIALAVEKVDHGHVTVSRVL